MEGETNKLKHGSGYEIRIYEFPMEDGSSAIVRRLVDIDTNESLYFGQAQIMVQVPTPQGPMAVPQMKWFPIEGAMSPKNALELSVLAFEQFKMSLPGGGGIITAPAGALPPAPRPAKGGNGKQGGMQLVR